MTAPDFTTRRLADGVLAPAGASLVLAEWTAEGAPGEGPPMYQAPLHSHEEDEAWYVLEGTLRVRVGQEEVEVSAGGAVIVPGGMPHTFYNPRPEPVRYLLTMGARTWQLIQAIHAASDRTPEAMRRLFEEHGARLLE
jgi:mannose-6-phosphate isomerase-like protein (cupin superfamily)